MLLEDNPDIDIKSKEMIENIKKHCSDMIRLIDKILEYSILSNKKIELEKIDISELIDELVTEYKIANPARHLNFRINGESIEIIGDRVLIKDAIGNIISNAVKYTSNRETAEIEIELKKNGNENIISITDNGIGFDMKHKDKIFNIFQRLHSYDEYEGSGIGLTLARKIIGNHGGKIEIDSIKDEGTKVESVFTNVEVDKNAV